jgi:hypothetical protein
MVLFVAVSMVGGTIRRKVIHRESFRASVLHHSENQAVLQSIATKKCLLTTPSLLSSATQFKSLSHPPEHAVIPGTIAKVTRGTASPVSRLAKWTLISLFPERDFRGVNEISFDCITMSAP